MIDYSKFSDEEISKSVGDVMGVEWANLDHNYHNLSYWKDRELCVFSPCRNPDEAWPIIEEHEINILWNWNDEGVHGATASPLYECEHENALRAAMIVFLMKHG